MDADDRTTADTLAGVDERATTADLAEVFRRRSWQVVAFGFLFLLGLISAVGFLVKVDYVAIVPGSARDTEPLVVVEGTDVYPSEGEILYTTIRLRQDMDVWTYLWTKAAGDSELIPADQYFGTLTPEESRQINLERMTSSKDTAMAVALDHLGYDIISDAGVVVAEVIVDSPADGVLEPGDVLSAVDGRPVTSDVQLVDQLTDYAPGDTVPFEVTRAADGSVDSVEITLAENPERPGVGFIGIRPATLADIGEPPFVVDIDSGSVGGPSAGLAFTLAILDDLTEGELTGGARVAVTGTIGIDGRVGPIGGIRQKAVAVRDAGATVFLVPASQSDDEIAYVRERAGDGVQVIPVDTLDEALAALGSIGGDVEAIEEFALTQD